MGTKVSVAASLLIVALIAMAGALSDRKNIDLKSAIEFGIPATIGTFIGAKVGLLLSDQTQMLIFGTVMLLTLYFMVRNPNLDNRFKDIPFIFVMESLLVGIITGIVGVGGGFLIVPVLHLSKKLSMKKAIATSLVIIAIKSLVGFMGYAGSINLDYYFIGLYILIGAIGVVVAKNIKDKIPEENIKKVFNALLFLVSIVVILNNI